jgi:hypothetical protein
VYDGANLERNNYLTPRETPARLLTCFLYAGKFGWNVLIGLHLMNQISARYETMGPICTRRTRGAVRPAPSPSPYHPRGDSSDYAFALLLGMAGILLCQTLLLPRLPAVLSNVGLHHRSFHRHLKFFVLYVWSKQRPDHRVNLLGATVSAAYLPHAYLLIGYALNNGESIPVDILHGMLVGHVYYYLACVVPRVSGGRRAVLSTPTALVDVCNWLEGRGGPPPHGGGGDDDGGGGDGRGEQPLLADVDGVIGG